MPADWFDATETYVESGSFRPERRGMKTTIEIVRQEARGKPFVSWDDFTEIGKEKLKHLPFGVLLAELKSIEEERDLFLRLNWAGTAMTEEDKERALKTEVSES